MFVNYQSGKVRAIRGNFSLDCGERKGVLNSIREGLFTALSGLNDNSMSDFFFVFK